MVSLRTVSQPLQSCRCRTWQEGSHRLAEKGRRGYSTSLPRSSIRGLERQNQRVHNYVAINQFTSFMLRILFQVKNECIAIDNLDILSDVNGSQRIITREHDTLQGDGKELVIYYDGNSLTLCDVSAKPLSVSTASSLGGQWKTRKPANCKLLSTCL